MRQSHLSCDNQFADMRKWGLSLPYLPQGDTTQRPRVCMRFGDKGSIKWRDKKPFLSDQCKEIEESNGMGNNRNLFKKIRDTKGIFHAKMSTIKDRNDMDPTEAEDTKKRWQEYTEELYKKDLLYDPDNHNGVITHLEPDILESQVR